MLRLTQLVLVLCSAILFSSPTFAQTSSSPSSGSTAAAPVVPTDLTPEQVDDLVARMSDDQVRALLLERLDAVAEAHAAKTEGQEDPLTEINEIWAEMVASWTHVLVTLPNIFSAQAEAFGNFGSTFGTTGVFVLLGLVLTVLVLGYAAEKLFGLLTRKWHAQSSEGEDGDLWGAVRYLFTRFCHEIAGLIVFYVVIRAAGRAILTTEQITYAAPFVFFLIWIPRLGAAVSRFVLAPNKPRLRLVNVDDHWAKYLHRNLIGLLILIGLTLFTLRFNALNGITGGETRIGFWLNTAIHIYIGFIAWTAREGLTQMMLGTDPDRTKFDEEVARYYPYFAIAVSAVIWLLVEFLAAQRDPSIRALLVKGPHFTTMFWLLIAPALDTLIRGLVRHLQPPMSGEGPLAEKAYKSTKRSYIRIGRVLAGLFVVMMIARAWELDLRHVASAGIGAEVGGAVIEFLLIVAAGYIINEVVSLWINRRLAKEQTAAESVDEEAGGEGGGSGGSRLATVLPLIRVTAQITIAVLFGLLALSSLGINITPLLAGAGVLGLAIGFGAQKLVADIVGGVFFLIDDAFRVGEYVDVGGTTGTVEKISIRSMQLRHHRGPVHTIPYGEIQKLTNYSRDWVIMKLKFTVPFDTDPNKVKKIFKKIGAEMMADEIHKDGFLEPFKSQGVFDFDDVGMIIRGKFMAIPGKQFTLRKEIYNRVKAAFKENGIDFARREVRVAIPGLDEAEHVTDEQKATIGAAAGEAVNQQLAKDQGGQ
ncbi:mechanosensitive ion channel family protein [Ruegeria sp. 2205SS24-7]|uniref:mechanosensitive ion channel family protein n=1 Tax=Ruegeria discodermiae TaxID=3064389 RepID=UPI00274213E8|nr:mechanosensitive ion channel family protein [Ruegeria sp. 2205SS24-7]MDP5216505.1 mechanosensitive ion channel family protein [Ruegeria sp. 2205SS24-7]